MGAQSSLLGLSAAVGIGAAKVAGAVKDAQNQKEIKKEKTAATEEDVAYSEAELAQAQAIEAEAGYDLEEGKKTVEAAQANYDAAMAKKPGGKGNTKASIEEKQQEALNDLTAAQKAFDVLEKKDIAAKAMTARWQLRRDNAHNRLKQLGGIR